MHQGPSNWVPLGSFTGSGAKQNKRELPPNWHNVSGFMTGRLALLNWRPVSVMLSSAGVMTHPASGDVSMRHFLFALLFHWRANTTISFAADKSPLRPHYMSTARPPLSKTTPPPSLYLCVCLSTCCDLTLSGSLFLHRYRVKGGELERTR